MYFHRRQTCTKRLSTPKFVTCNLKSELKFFQPYTTQTNMKVRTLKSRNKHWLCPGADWTVGKSVIYRIKFTKKKKKKKKKKKEKKKKKKIEKKEKKKKRKNKKRNKRKNIKKENSEGKTKTHRPKRASDLCVESD